VVSSVRGLQRVLERAVDVIEGARSSLFVSVWPDEAEALRSSLERAVERGVDLSVLVFGEFDPPVGRVYTHRYSPPAVVLERLGRKIFTVIADHDNVVIAGIDNNDVWGVWSDDAAVALVAAEYVRHDIALQLIAERLHDTGLDDFWRNDPQLERLRSASGMSSVFRSVL
jgi:sugar-specific transcriptional regulator TrmB